MERALPIIYVRGYAGSQRAVEGTVELPYYGFNLGSTRVRTGAGANPELRIFESPLVRLMKDHGYRDFFARIGDGGEVEMLGAQHEAECFPERSLWIYRYYDVTSKETGQGQRDDIEGLAEGLGKLVKFVIERTGAPQVHLVAHSMGGLICRSLIQRILEQQAPERIARLFTYGTPHRGIHFRKGLGFLATVRDLFGFNDADTFGARRMRAYLGFGAQHPEDRLNEIGNHFPASRVFSFVGTNHEDYNLARLAVGPGSDGLVQIDHAYVRGSNRAFAYRAHSGPYGVVNSEEGYQNLQRFLFGDTTVRIALQKVRLEDSLRDDDTLQHLLLEAQIAIRGGEVLMTDQREEHGSAIRVRPKDLEEGEETLFRTFLMRSKRPTSQDRYSHFQVRLRILPIFERNRRILRDRHYVGEHVFQDVLTVGIRDPDAQDGRLIRARWASLDEDLPGSGTRYLEDGSARFELKGRHIASGELVLFTEEL
jgi:pimeloyl-ACP methyl ester carboxylesterase